MPNLSPTTRCRAVPARRTALGLVAVTAVAAAIVLPSGAALAVPSTITSKTDLDNQIRLAPQNASSTTELELGSSLTTSESAHDTLTTPTGSRISLDLHGNDLSLKQITLGSGSVLTLTDSTATADDGSSADVSIGSWSALSSTTAQGVAVAAGATLEVEAIDLNAYGAANLAGIGSPQSVTTGAGALEVTGGAYVDSSGGSFASGIGGAPSAAAISVDVIDSNVSGTGGIQGAGIGSGRNGASAGTITATTSPVSSSDDSHHYSYISGDGGRGAAGIGGGAHASGSTVELSGSTSARARTAGAISGEAGTPSAVGLGQNPGSGTTFGALTIHEDASLMVSDGSSGSTLTGSDLSIPASTTVQNDGRIALGARSTVSGAGTIANAGTIETDDYYYSWSPTTPTVDPGSRVGVAQVTGHNYAITMDPNGGTAGAYSVAHVFSDRWDPQHGAQPTPPGQGQAVMGWTTRSDGSGEDVNNTSLQDLTGQLSTTGAPVVLTAFARYGVLPHLTASTIASAGLGVPYDTALPIDGELQGAYVAEYDDQFNAIPGLPPGLSIDYENSNGDEYAVPHITGTPTQAGTFRFRVGMYVRNTPTIYDYVTIKIAGVPAIGTVSLPDAQQGSTYSTRLAASGDGAVTWDLASGSLPAGLSLSPAGVLSGTPTAAGTGTFTVRATTEYGPSTQQLRLNVAAAPAPSVTGTPAPTTSSRPTTASTPAPAAAAAASAPTLPAVPRTTVRFGHRLELAATASSTVPVHYTVSGALPKGISLNSATGVLSGVAAESGTFSAIVTATSTAGSATTSVTIDVPAVQELLDGRTVPATRVGASSTKLSVAGFQKGEHYRVLVDGKVAKTGVMKKAGTLRTTVRLKAAKHDTVHHIVVAGSRPVTDPAKTASTSFAVTTLASKKRLSAAVSRTGGAVKVQAGRLAAGEHVTVRDGRTVIARGTADAHGLLTIMSKALARGTHHLTVTGATKHRTTRVTVKPGH